MPYNTLFEKEVAELFRSKALFNKEGGWAFMLIKAKSGDLRVTREVGILCSSPLCKRGWHCNDKVAMSGDLRVTREVGILCSSPLCKRGWHCNDKVAMSGDLRVTREVGILCSSPLCKRGWLSFYVNKSEVGWFTWDKGSRKVKYLESRLPMSFVNPPTQMLLQAFEPPPFAKEAC